MALDSFRDPMTYSEDLGKLVTKMDSDSYVGVLRTDAGSSQGIWMAYYESATLRMATSLPNRRDTRMLTVRIWDAQTGASIGKPLKGHEESVYAVAYSLDGSRIVSGLGMPQFGPGMHIPALKLEGLWRVMKKLLSTLVILKTGVGSSQHKMTIRYNCGT
ncbi:hypothetical protein ACEPAF_20 [Sanghuangporus sanghuang]